MRRWAVSMVVAAWPKDGSWTGMLCEYFSNGEITDAPSGLDLIERWSIAARASLLPLSNHNGAATVHGRLGLIDESGEHFVIVVTWTPWQAPDEFAIADESRPRDWAEAEVERFLDDPYRFSPKNAHASTATGLFNKLQRYVGHRRHVADHATLGTGWLTSED